MTLNEIVESIKFYISFGLRRIIELYVIVNRLL